MSPDEKSWIERRFAWLTDEFGASRVQNRPLVLPTTEFFPDDYNGTREEVVEISKRVAAYMDVTANLHLNFYEDEHPRFAAGFRDGATGFFSESRRGFEISLEAGQLDDPFGVVATLAHEIGHVLLLGQRRISPNEEDHEPLTDLLTVFFGLGIFTANSVIHERNWNDGEWSGWSVGRSGYLSMDMFGYALALYALARGESKPDWARHLRPDVRSALRKSLRYITVTGDCSYEFPTATEILPPADL